ncbi:MAG TPA: hypothetical protein VKV24_21460 [Casimicrobiaceae bacterium]|nr:hypothetical protein [Casimicrobiaceae bacterium]
MRDALEAIVRGIAGAIRARPRVLVGVAAVVFAVDLFLPPIVLSIVRKPFDYFTFNAWLHDLPAYIANGSIDWSTKLRFLSDLALFWFSADSPFGGVDWGFAVTVSDLLRIIALSLLFGLYFALVLNRRSASSAGVTAKRGGIAGAFASVFGLSTGGCTVMGCGAPVIPVVGLAFAGLSSGALSMLAQLSRIATTGLFAILTLAVLYLAWRTGARSTREVPLPMPLLQE